MHIRFAIYLRHNWVCPKMLAVILSAHWCTQLENAVCDCSIYRVLVLKLIICLPKCDFDLVWNMKMACADCCFGCIFMHESLCTTWREAAVSHILLWDLCFASAFLVLYIWTIVYMDVNPKPKQRGVSCACESGGHPQARGAVHPGRVASSMKG